MRGMSPAGLAGAALVGLALCAAPAAAKTVKVLNNNDSGPNSFRSAIAEANADPAIDRIMFRPGASHIQLQTSVVYSGTQALTIDGRGAVITENGADDLLVANGGGDLDLRNIAFVEALRSGVVVNVPGGDTAREQTVSLDHVVLHGNGWYGLHFDDQSGGDGTGSDSASSLRLNVKHSRITGNNNSVIESVESDKDGIRVDEGGEGDVTAVVSHSVFHENSGDGLEIDEIDDGDVEVSVIKSSFNTNGAQPQNPDDLEDGLDVDEAGGGDVWVTIVNTEINENQDEGLDLDEADEGGIYLTTVKMDASGNLDENVKLTQTQDDSASEGGIVARFRNSTVNDSVDGDGIKLESFDTADDEGLVGEVLASVQNCVATGNDSDDIQIEAASGALVVRASNVGEIDLSPGITLTTIP
jgi:hypothetical protein